MVLLVGGPGKGCPLLFLLVLFQLLHYICSMTMNSTTGRIPSTFNYSPLPLVSHSHRFCHWFTCLFWELSFCPYSTGFQRLLISSPMTNSLQPFRLLSSWLTMSSGFMASLWRLFRNRDHSSPRMSGRPSALLWEPRSVSVLDTIRSPMARQRGSTRSWSLTSTA